MTDQEFLKYMKDNHRGNNPLLRYFMSKDEIKHANRLVKSGDLVKGTAVEDARMRVYYYDKND